MKLTKRIISLLLILACLGTCVPMVAVQASDTFPPDFYLTQTRRGTCTLCSAAMMLRGAMYYSGNQDWNLITENGIRPVAWLEGAGLYWNFTYTLGNTSLTVGNTLISGVTVDGLKKLLDKYTDGIVLYCGNLPHAVYLIDYVGDTFYCAETIENYSGKRITLAESWLGNQYGSQANVLKNVTAYWYIKEKTVAEDCGCSATFAGTYTCATSSSNLTIRTGHGTDYDAVGSIPPGAEVYVTRASGEDDTDWAHVTYDGMSGYVSMKYLKPNSPVTLRASGKTLALALDGVKSQTMQFWTSGEYTDPISMSWTRSNNNVSLSWGDMEGGKYPLTVTAKKPGTTQITITATDSQTGDVLDTMVVDVTVGRNSYSVTYNGNGGTDVPEGQIKVEGAGLTLSGIVPSRLGYTFLGWATHPGATAATYLPGSAYLNDAELTLFAVWQKAKTIPGNTADSNFTTAITVPGGHQTYSFVPNRSGMFTFESSGDLDTRLWIFNAAGEQVAYNNNGGPGDNFLVTTELTGGKTYYLRVKSESTGAVNFRMTQDLPYITGQSANVFVAEGQIARVSFTAVGQELTYEWYYANAGLDTFTKTTAFSTESYYIPMTEARNGRRVYCVITDKYGNKVTSDTVTLTMKKNLEIVKQPVSVEVLDGEMAKVTVRASGDGLRYTWYYANPGSDTFRKTSSFTTNSYYVAMNDDRDGRRVYCVITDKYGSRIQTNTVTLSTPEPVKITTQPVDVMVPKGEMAKVTLVADGDGLTYEWYYAAAGSTNFKKTTAFSTNSYYIEMTDARDGRQVYCVVTDQYGNQVRSKTVTLSKEPPVIITKQPANVAVEMDQQAKVTVTAKGEGLKYAWYYADGDSEAFKLTKSFTTNSYYVTMTEARNGRRVYCVITDKDGFSVRSETVVLSESKTLRILAQPQSVTVGAGEKAEVTVVASGEDLSYVWYCAAPGTTAYMKDSDCKTATYTLTMDEAKSGTKVFCVVYDGEGNALQTVTVSMNMA